MDDKDDPVWMLNLIKRLTRTLMEADRDLSKGSGFIKDLQEQIGDLKSMNKRMSDEIMGLGETVLSLQKENAELKQQVEFLRKCTQASVAVGTGVTGPFVVVETA